MSSLYSTARVDSNNGHSSPIFGRVYWSSTKSLWISLMYAGALTGGYATFRWDAFALFGTASAITLCAGYSVGLHRRLVHNSFQCPQWVENALVYLGILVGLGGPFSFIEQHDLHEWAQRQPRCHPYFTSRQNLLKDWYWTLHCEIQLDYPPIVSYEPRITGNGFYQWLQQTWMLQQLPWAIAFYLIGGWSWLFWGIYVRIGVCATLLWLVKYLGHRAGDRPRHLRRAAVQRCNVRGLGLLAVGEGWQNNHQSFPGSAKFGLKPYELDPGWWFIKALSYLGLAWKIKKPRTTLLRQLGPLPSAIPQPATAAVPAATIPRPKVTTS